MRQKLGKASDLGHSFNIQDGADTSNMKEKKEYIRSMKNITRRVLILNVEGFKAGPVIQAASEKV